MSKSIKPKNNTYWSTQGIVHGRELLSSKLLLPYQLFYLSGGTSDDSITLSDYIENYEYIEIFYSNNDERENSVKVKTKNRSNIKVCLNSVTLSDTYEWTAFAEYILNSDKLLKNREKLTRIRDGGIDYSTNETYIILITEVIGYK